MTAVSQAQFRLLLAKNNESEKKIALLQEQVESLLLAFAKKPRDADHHYNPESRVYNEAFRGPGPYFPNRDPVKTDAWNAGRTAREKFGNEILDKQVEAKKAPKVERCYVCTEHPTHEIDGITYCMTHAYKREKPEEPKEPEISDNKRVIQLLEKLVSIKELPVGVPPVRRINESEEWYYPG